ncbi:MAG TPA: glycosyltransferase [Acidimicrobiales bacterium]|nr:glycosyltransferase [Acidimicrobiales bacterium]
MRRLAVLSLHSSPLLQPGSGDAGGMNVYVRELVASLAQAGVQSTVYVRRWRDDLPPVVTVEPGFRVVHIPAGPASLAKEQLLSTVDEFTDFVIDDLRVEGDVDALHANYWLSGIAAHRIKHTLDLPLVSVFHTLARVKADTGDAEPQRRVDAESEVIRCSDVIIANSRAEADQLEHYYHADPSRVEVVPPGVDHAFFSPGNKQGARKALGLGAEPVLLFVGRIQPLKGAAVAIEALARSRHRDAKLLIVGAASGIEGNDEVRRVHALVDALRLRDRVVFVPPQPHHVLSTYYRAADVVLVPSRSESFGLVALEAAACGTPVVAAAVGGLLTLVDDGRTGYLIDSREPQHYTTAIDRILGDESLRQALSAGAIRSAANYTWATTAARLRRIYADLVTRAPLRCD